MESHKKWRLADYTEYTLLHFPDKSCFSLVQSLVFPPDMVMKARQVVCTVPVHFVREHGAVLCIAARLTVYEPDLNVTEAVAALLLFPLAKVVTPELFPPGPHKFRLQPFSPFTLIAEVQHHLEFCHALR